MRYNQHYFSARHRPRSRWPISCHNCWCWEQIGKEHGHWKLASWNLIGSKSNGNCKWAMPRRALPATLHSPIQWRQSAAQYAWGPQPALQPPRQSESLKIDCWNWLKIAYKAYSCKANLSFSWSAAPHSRGTFQGSSLAKRSGGNKKRRLAAILCVALRFWPLVKRSLF